MTHSLFSSVVLGLKSPNNELRPFLLATAAAAAATTTTTSDAVDRYNETRHGMHSGQRRRRHIQREQTRHAQRYPLSHQHLRRHPCTAEQQSLHVEKHDILPPRRLPSPHVGFHSLRHPSRPWMVMTSGVPRDHQHPHRRGTALVVSSDELETRSAPR